MGSPEFVLDAEANKVYDALKKANKKLEWVTTKQIAPYLPDWKVTKIKTRLERLKRQGKVDKKYIYPEGKLVSVWRIRR